jgi:hypothetical protein
MDQPCYYTAGLPRLLDEYTHAAANAYSPDTDTAIARLKEIRDRVEKALALTEGKPVERLHYRAALDEIIAHSLNPAFDEVQVAHEAIAPFTEWRAIEEDLGFNSPADRRAREAT